jgi:hypothetical protein
MRYNVSLSLPLLCKEGNGEVGQASPPRRAGPYKGEGSVQGCPSSSRQTGCILVSIR